MSSPPFFEFLRQGFNIYSRLAQDFLRSPNCSSLKTPSAGITSVYEPPRLAENVDFSWLRFQNWHSYNIEVGLPQIQGSPLASVSGTLALWVQAHSQLLSNTSERCYEAARPLTEVMSSLSSSCEQKWFLKGRVRVSSRPGWWGWLLSSSCVSYEYYNHKHGHQETIFLKTMISKLGVMSHAKARANIYETYLNKCKDLYLT